LGSGGRTSPSSAGNVLALAGCASLMPGPSVLALAGCASLMPGPRKIIRPDERYFDDRGQAMWNTVTRLLAKLERETA
jgi:hypothetical protein